MHILAIDTAGPVVGVALLAGDLVRARTARVRRGADALLLPWAEELVAEAGISLRQLDGIGVAHGPGAFTGLRVGLATAVGLALAIDRPLWGVSSLEARAARVPEAVELLTMLDARKGRVYAAARTCSGPRGPGDIPPEEALSWMTSPFVATGEGAIVFRELVEAAGGQLSADPGHPGVDALARLAQQAIAAGLGAPAASVTPVYLRAPDAKPPNNTRIERGH